MSSKRPNLTIPEYLDLWLTCFRAVLVGALAVFAFPFRGDSSHQDIASFVSYAANKFRNAKASARQLQYLNPPTEEVYLACADAKHFDPATTALPHGQKALWIGSQDVSKVLVFFHGGGYVKPATTQLELLWDLKKTLGSQLAICLISYSLAPRAQYPVQLQQAIGLLRYLMNDAGKKPENMILVGDSAGGNLILGLLSHLLHPHPSLEPLVLPKPLLGAAVISPWGDFNTSAPSYTSNQYKDSVNAAVLQKWSDYFMGSAKADEYNQPFRAASSWWENLSGKVQNMLITAGSDEVLVDDIMAFAEKIKMILPNTDIVLGMGEVHDQPFMEPMVVEKDRSEQARALKTWLKARM